MSYKLPDEIRSIFEPLADAVFPLQRWVQKQKRAGPRPDQLIPPQASLPWRPAGKLPTLGIEQMEVLAFFERAFDEADDEKLVKRWRALRRDPLDKFQCHSGVSAALWRAGREGLKTSARFGAIEADEAKEESRNIRYVLVNSAGEEEPVTRAAFYDACWGPLLQSYERVRPSDTASWQRFGRALHEDRFEQDWAEHGSLKSSVFIKHFATDILMACLGQRNAALRRRDPIWQRAVLIEASENRHVGNKYTNQQVAGAVDTLRKAIADAKTACPFSSGWRQLT